jgi:hypothetical protein
VVGHRSSPWAGTALFPAIDLDVVWMGPGFKQRLQAEQKHRLLGAALLHELDGLLPALIFEDYDRPVTSCLRSKLILVPIHSFGPSTTCHNTCLLGSSSTTFMSMPPAPKRN